MAKKQADYQLIFCAHNGPGPYICVVCRGEIQPPWMMVRKGPLFLHVHHHDGNHDNNTPDNLKPVHSGCHNSLHGRKGQKLTPQHAAALEAGRKKFWASKPKKERIVHTAESRAAALAARKLLPPDERRRRYSRWSHLPPEIRSQIGKAMRAGKPWRHLATGP